MVAQNLTLLTDLYELTMMQGYYKTGENDSVIFDVFYRKNPSGSGYAIACGLEQVIDYIKNLSFSYDDIDYLRGLGIFDEDFLEYLAGYHFTGDIYAIPEGTVVFPKDTLFKSHCSNHGSPARGNSDLKYHQPPEPDRNKGFPCMLCCRRRWSNGIRTSARAGSGRRTLGARAAMIGGCIGTSNVLTGQLYDVPVLGTHAHSWIMSFKDEYTAFKTYADMYPDSCTLLVDTYDTLNSGVPNAIRVFQEMRDAGIKPKSYGIRLDSGGLGLYFKGSAEKCSMLPIQRRSDRCIQRPG